MSGVAELARAWFQWTVAASWQLALLVCLIAVLTYLLRYASARLRYGLWLLVLLKAFLPPTLAAFWGVGTWGVAPVVDLPWQSGTVGQITNSFDSGPLGSSRKIVPTGLDDSPTRLSTSSWLLFVWAAGCVAIWLAVAWRYGQIMRMTSSMRRVDEGPARVELERLAARLHVRKVPDLCATERAVSPMLVGVLRPKIIVPESLLEQLNSQELRMILAHELVHWRRRDTWVGWLQVFVQGVFWFHPLVWLANERIRHERDCACDEAVLREARCDRDEYGETIIQVLTATSSRSLVMANMAGVFERGSRLQTRLEEIMSFDANKRRFGWISRAALVTAALVLLPMGAPRVQADPADAPAAPATAGETKPAGSDEAVKPGPRTNWPVIVSSTPEIGATDVDPELRKISVTFDRDMDVTGYSWTGGGPYYPPTQKGAGPVWIDRRTCQLPVTLKKGSFYRVGINSTSFRNFRSKLGVPAPTSAIYFVTSNASRGVISRVRVPKVVKLSPENRATDVNPDIKILRVTFNMAMGTGGYSWTGGGPTFPTTPKGKKTQWSRDARTCRLPVQLKPGTRYELGLNSVHHKNFASKWGVPLEPVRYEFQTAGDAPQDESASGPPRIVKMEPENGGTDVKPTCSQIKVTFDRSMAGGFSWTGGGEHFPLIPQGKKPYWSDDQKTCTLPVKLRANWQYRLGLNSVSFKNFASADGVPLEPVVYEFRTSPRD